MMSRASDLCIRFGIVLCTAFLWAGCAGLPGAGGASDTPPFRDPALSMQRAGELIVAGQSTRADVMAALGPATVVHFDSGFEVWVYRTKASGASEEKDEFVILFTPAGLVKKTRIRRGPASIAK
jgi:hypothetical protein